MTNAALGYLQDLSESLTSFAANKRLKAPKLNVIKVVISDYNFIVPLEDIVQIAVDIKIAPLPWTKAWVKGLGNLRGELITIFDFASHFGLRATNKSQILVVQSNSELYGVIVDKVIGMEAVDLNFDEVADEFRKETSSEFIKGSYIECEKKWYFLDIKKYIDSIAADTICLNNSNIR